MSKLRTYRFDAIRKDNGAVEYTGVTTGMAHAAKLLKGELSEGEDVDAFEIEIGAKALKMGGGFFPCEITAENER